MTWGTSVFSWEHFQGWTQAVSYTSSVNRVADSAVSSTHNHHTVTVFSLFRFENNTQEQSLVMLQSLATSHSRYQLIQKLVQFLTRTAGHTWEVQAFRGWSPGPAPLRQQSQPLYETTQLVAYHRLSSERSFSLPHTAAPFWDDLVSRTHHT